MKHRTFTTSRRRFLAGGAALVGAFPLMSGRARAALGLVPRWAQDEDDDRTLVVVQLAGGNDGLNTIVPYADDLYHRARQKVHVEPKDVLRIDDYRGFHPLWPGMARTWEDGRLAIVEGVGYPEPNRSHFASFDIWHAADTRGRAGGYGWLARLSAALQRRTGPEATTAVHVGDRMPYSMYSPSHPSLCFGDPALYQWSQSGGEIADVAAPEKESPAKAVELLRSTFQKAKRSSEAVREAALSYEPRADYPPDGLGVALRHVAALIQGGVGSRILSVELSGFDTHSAQVPMHHRLLSSVDGAVSAFLDDLHGTPAGERTTVMMFSEFGRRVAENGSDGTDHGTAGPMFLAGAPVRGGLYGEHPSLEELDEGDLVFGTDFRSVYATVIEGWFGVPQSEVLSGSYPTLPVFRS